MITSITKTDQFERNNRLMKTRNLPAAIAIVMALLISTVEGQTQTAGKKSVAPAAANTPVTGSGTVGRLSKWTGADSSNSFTLGNSIIFEDKFGKVGIGTTTPTSTLTVVGMIETTLGGYKFPDGTIQTTAGLASVFHNATLTGNGTAASPLGVAIPLTLTGSVPDPSIAVLKIVNTGTNGRGLFAQGGRRGTGVTGVGGDDPQGDIGGVGVEAFGGAGGNSESGPGVLATGGASNGPPAGTGVIALGGANFGSGPGGAGVEATGGTNVNSGDNGPGVKATGGTSGAAKPGDGVIATGGNYNGPNNALSGGSGVLATGGNGKFGGSGVEAKGGTGSLNTPGGTGVLGTGGNASGSVNGGAGVRGVGGMSPAGLGGTGVSAGGANGELLGGFGLDANGGRSNGGTGGAGIRSFGGGGGFTGNAIGNGGQGVIAVGGEANGAGKTGGDGLVARGGQGMDGATPGRAGVFNGDVQINGALNVSGTKNFKIDHPLDPANKYLYHAAIESSEILNVYSGNVKTDKKGEAIVTLPDWFEALNKDFRYQLTPIGAPAQGLYIAEKVYQNRFKIAGAKPHMEISWQVTSIRNDAATRQLTFKVEEEKPVHERGTYLSPEAYGEPKEKGIKWARNPERMDETQPMRAKQPEVSKPKAQGRDR
jgi:trimeric autotransporter adhesin